MDWRPGFPVDAPRILSALGRGPGDPCHRLLPDGAIWRTSLMASGPVSYRITQPDRGQIRAEAWGAGGPEFLVGLPDLLGARDTPEAFEPLLPVLAHAAKELVGYRVPRTGRVIEALVPAVLEQKVIGLDAMAAFRRLVTRFGRAAPGPAPSGMRVPPDAAGWRAIPSWEWHRAGVDPRRARVVRSALAVADKLEAAAAADDQVLVYRILLALPGIGRWTAAEVGSRALGDADALPVGDYHLPALASHTLAGRVLAEDEVEEFFEPWRPHRYRVVRLLELSSAVRVPRRGPRLSRVDYRRF